MSTSDPGPAPSPRGRNTTVLLTGDEHTLTLRWNNFQGGWGLKAVMIAVVAAPSVLCIAPLMEVRPVICGVAGAIVPVVLAVLFVLTIAGGRVEVTLSARGLERRAVSGLGLPSLSTWSGPIAVQIAPLWSFDTSGAIMGIEQYNVGFLHGPGIPIDSLVLDQETAAALALGVTRLSTPAVTLDARELLKTAPSSMCINCGYDLLGTPVPRCPECGTAVDANRFELLRRMYQESRGTDQPPPPPTDQHPKQGSTKEQA